MGKISPKIKAIKARMDSSEHLCHSIVNVPWFTLILISHSCYLFSTPTEMQWLIPLPSGVARDSGPIAQNLIWNLKVKLSGRASVGPLSAPGPYILHPCLCSMSKLKMERESLLTSSGHDVKANHCSIYIVLFFTDVFYNPYFYTDATIH